MLHGKTGNFLYSAFSVYASFLFHKEIKIALPKLLTIFLISFSQCGCESQIGVKSGRLKRKYVNNDQILNLKFSSNIGGKKKFENLTLFLSCGLFSEFSS